MQYTTLRIPEIQSADQKNAVNKTIILIRLRGVAQFGSAPDWGSGGRRFKSCLSDHQKILRISSVPRIFLFDGNP